MRFAVAAGMENLEGCDAGRMPLSQVMYNFETVIVADVMSKQRMQATQR